MLLNFTLSNFKSYNEPQKLTTIPGKYRKKGHHVVKKKNMNILKFSAIYGGNASGKSNFVEAIKISKQMITKGRVTHKYENLAFKLDTTNGTVSNFEFEIAIGEKKYAYGFAIDFLQGKLLKEYLFLLKKEDETIYDFDYSKDDLYFNMKNVDTSNSSRIAVYKEDFQNKDSEFFLHHMSTGNFKDMDDVVNDIIDVYDWFKTKLTIITPTTSLMDIIGLLESSREDDCIDVIDIIKSFDTGVTGYSRETIGLDKLLNLMRDGIPKAHHNQVDDFIELVNKLTTSQAISMNFEDNSYKIKLNKETKIPEIQLVRFIHCNNDSVSFSHKEESDGTRRLIELVNILYSSQFSNRVFIVDEINRSLHPNLTTSFIEKFLELSSDNESQLIVTTHEVSVMNLDLLRQDEIWIVDRDKYGASSMLSMSKYDIRSDKVLDKDYLNGRYGGTPHLLRLIKTRGDN